MNKSGDIISRLSHKGYRMTPQRMMILEAVEAAKDHISAEEIYTRVCNRYPHLNISTVYRTLELLKELKLVTETDMGDGRVRYHSIRRDTTTTWSARNAAKLLIWMSPSWLR
jgi:Fur family ferric uptake transcriptional regulator